MLVLVYAGWVTPAEHSIDVPAALTRVGPKNVTKLGRFAVGVGGYGPIDGRSVAARYLMGRERERENRIIITSQFRQ